MSFEPTADSAPTPAPSTPPRKTAEARLKEIRRSLQRQAKRRLNNFEQDALDTCALLTLRSEMAALDPKASSEDIVRLANVARRARVDFMRIAMIDREAPRPSLHELMKGAAAHG